MSVLLYRATKNTFFIPWLDVAWCIELGKGRPKEGDYDDAAHCDLIKNR